MLTVSLALLLLVITHFSHYQLITNSQLGLVSFHKSIGDGGLE